MGSRTETVISIPIEYNQIVASFLRSWEIRSAKILREEISHFEDRYDYRTGEKLNPVKVVDMPQVISQPVIMRGVFLTEEDYQTFKVGPGNCLMCNDYFLNRANTNHIGGWSCSEEHRDLCNKHEISASIDEEDHYNYDAYFLANVFIEHLNKYHGDKFYIEYSGSNYIHFCLKELQKDLNNSSFITLNKIKTLLPEFEKLKEILQKFNLGELLEPAISLVYWE